MLAGCIVGRGCSVCLQQVGVPCLAMHGIVLRCLQKMIIKANLVCGICKMDCVSTEKILSTEKLVCLLKNTGGLQSTAAAAVGFFHLYW